MTYQQNKLVDDYIAQFDPDIKERLEKMRAAIHATFPHSIEDISYGMPTYRAEPKKRGFVHFAASKGHIGLYAIFDAKSNAPMHKLMYPYRTGKGTLQFKHSERFPIGTIRKILAYHATKLNS